MFWSMPVLSTPSSSPPVMPISISSQIYEIVAPQVIHVAYAGRSQCYSKRNKRETKERTMEVPRQHQQAGHTSKAARGRQRAVEKHGRRLAIVQTRLGYFVAERTGSEPTHVRRLRGAAVSNKNIQRRCMQQTIREPAHTRTTRDIYHKPMVKTADTFTLAVPKLSEAFRICIVGKHSSLGHSTKYTRPMLNNANARVDARTLSSAPLPPAPSPPDFRAPTRKKGQQKKKQAFHAKRHGRFTRVCTEPPAALCKSLARDRACLERLASPSSWPCARGTTCRSRCSPRPPPRTSRACEKRTEARRSSQSTPARPTPTPREDGGGGEGGATCIIVRERRSRSTRWGVVPSRRDDGQGSSRVV